MVMVQSIQDVGNGLGCFEEGGETLEENHMMIIRQIEGIHGMKSTPN